MSVEKVLIGNSEFVPSYVGKNLTLNAAYPPPTYIDPSQYDPDKSGARNVQIFGGTYPIKSQVVINGKIFVGIKNDYNEEYENVDTFFLIDDVIKNIGGVIRASYNKALSYFQRLEVA